MKPKAMRVLSAAVLVLAAATALSGCIVCVDGSWCDGHHSRPATLHVYVYDYFTGAPIPWAVVELYESDWWSWDYIGSWHVNSAGYVQLRAGSLYYDDHGGAEQENYRVVVHASGYFSEDYEIELSYYYPSETLSFYLAPFYGREQVDPGKTETDQPTPDATAEQDGPVRSTGKVIVGEPDIGAPESAR